MGDENKMFYMNELEISEFVAAIVKKHDFLYECLQDGSPVKEEIIKKLGKFRLTNNEIAVTSVQLTGIINEVAGALLIQTLNTLVQNKVTGLFIRKDGELCMGIKDISRQDTYSESQPK